MMLYYIAVLIFGLIAGFMSGLLGVGGGIIIIPVFLYLMPLLGFETLSVEQITGIASVQVIMGSFFAYKAHKKLGVIDKKLILTIGIQAAAGAFLGAVISKFIPGRILLIMYFSVLVFSLITLAPHKYKEKIFVKKDFNTFLTNLFTVVSGYLSGSLGVGGAVLYIPVLNSLYGMSLKASISNVTYIVLLTALATFLGKAATSQIPFNLIIFIIAGSFFGAKLGTIANQKLSSSILLKILMAIMIVTAIRVLFSII